jgi:hypothetical protein
MSLKKKILLIVAFIFISAIIIVLCMSFVNGGHKNEYDGTLVRMDIEFPELL